MLLTRVLAALVFAPTLLGLVYLGGLPLQITCGIIAALMTWEAMRLLGSSAYLHAVAYVLGVYLFLNVLGVLPHRLAAGLAPVVIVLVFSAMLIRPEPIPGASQRVGAILFGGFYGAALIPYLSLLRDQPSGLGLALMALFCTWGADTGAYFAGRFLGRHKLYERVSPKKTWEGAIGGVLAGVAVALVVRWLFHMPQSTGFVAGLGIVAAVLGTVGDLCESLLKRSVGAKDSSQLIPGHGGVLDRFDGVMFVAPAFYALVRVSG